MSKQEVLKPVDIAVVLLLAIQDENPGDTYSEFGAALGISASSVFESVERLQRSGLLRSGTWHPNVQELRNFLVHGVKHAFPPTLGRDAKGVPTAHAGPALSEQFDAAKPFVWPDVHGQSRGTSLVPLYPKAIGLPQRAPAVYAALTLIDALRVGQARERNAAVKALDGILGLKDASE